MKCPYRMNEVHDCRDCHDGITLVYMEFGDCYKKECPYYGIDKKGGWCQKVTKEVGYCRYEEVH